MDIDHWMKLIGTITSLLQVIIWPVFAILALFYLGRTIKDYFNDLRKDKNVSEVTAEAGPTGVKFAVKRNVEIATNLVLAKQAREDLETPSSKQAESETRTEEIINAVSKATTSQTILEIAGTKALWVDDNPSYNTYERRALEALGIQFTLSTSTEDALKKMLRNNYNVIISDMGRPPDNQAGYTLLEKLQKQSVTTPFIIYSGSNLPEHKAEIIKRGGFGTTNNPQELFELVLNAIHKSQSVS